MKPAQTNRVIASQPSGRVPRHRQYPVLSTHLASSPKEGNSGETARKAVENKTTFSPAGAPNQDAPSNGPAGSQAENEPLPQQPDAWNASMSTDPAGMQAHLLQLDNELRQLEQQKQLVETGKTVRLRQQFALRQRVCQHPRTQASRTPQHAFRPPQPGGPLASPPIDPQSLPFVVPPAGARPQLQTTVDKTPQQPVPCTKPSRLQNLQLEQRAVYDEVMSEAVVELDRTKSFARVATIKRKAERARRAAAAHAFGEAVRKQALPSDAPPAQAFGEAVRKQALPSDAPPVQAFGDAVRKQADASDAQAGALDVDPGS